MARQEDEERLNREVEWILPGTESDVTDSTESTKSNRSDDCYGLKSVDADWTPVTRRRNRFCIDYSTTYASKYCTGPDCCSVSHESSQEISAVERSHGNDKHRVHIDPGAVDTVGPMEIGRAFKIRETRAATEGNNYVAANGTNIKHYGEISPG